MKTLNNPRDRLHISTTNVLPSQSSVFDETQALGNRTTGATLEQHKHGSKLVSAIEATTWIEFAAA
jgi:hypothetical protein